VTAPASLYVAAAERPWFERRPGVQWKILFEDGERRTVLMRYAPGAVIPRHRHVGDEQIFVLEGSVSDDTGTCAAGDYARRLRLQFGVQARWHVSQAAENRIS